MAASDSLKRLTEALRALRSLLNDLNLPYAVIGGVAAGALGRPRFTKDIDVVTACDDFDAGFIASAERHCILPRISDPLDFARKRNVLLLTHAPSETGIDIALALLPFEMDLIANVKMHELEGVSVPLPRPEDLIVQKAIAGRHIDWADIEQIIDSNAQLDKEHIVRCVTDFSELLEIPERVEQIKSMLK